MALTDEAVRSAKPRDKPYKISDGGGLFILVNTNGSKWWRFRYFFEGKEKLLALGVFPRVGLNAAKAGKLAAQTWLAAGVDPMAIRREEKSSKKQTTHGNDKIPEAVRECLLQISSDLLRLNAAIQKLIGEL